MGRLFNFGKQPKREDREVKVHINKNGSFWVDANELMSSSIGQKALAEFAELEKLAKRKSDNHHELDADK